MVATPRNVPALKKLTRDYLKAAHRDHNAQVYLAILWPDEEDHLIVSR